MCGSRQITSAVVEWLESRQLFADMLELSAVAPINAFDGVGFQRNPVAYATYTKNGKGVASSAGLTATVNFGDGKGWESAELAPLGTAGEFVVKSGHTYNAGVAKTFNVETKITGPGVSDDLVKSTTVNNKLMPAAASRPGAQPPFYGTMKVSDVKLFVTNVPTFTVYAGAGFNRNTLAIFSSKLNNVTDTDITHFTAQVNFGDGQYWEKADIAYKGTTKTNYVVKNRAHTYSKAGSYPITLVLSGPDGTTLSQQVTTVTAKDLPTVAGRGGVAPTPSIGSAQDVWMSYADVPPSKLTAGKSATLQIGYLTAKVQNVADKNGANYMVYVNWGDSPTWQPGVVKSPTTASMPMGVFGTHTYAKAGSYQIVVQLIGTDGTTLTQQGVTIYVQ